MTMKDILHLRHMSRLGKEMSTKRIRQIAKAKGYKRKNYDREIFIDNYELGVTLAIAVKRIKAKL